MYNKDGDNLTITLDANDITLPYDLSEYITTEIDISNITTSIIDSDLTITADDITWEQIEFEDTMPSVAKVEDMCKDYPALEQAYEKFKTMYALVHQDWKGRQETDA